MVAELTAPHRASASGFSLAELLISITILLVISSTVTSGLLKLTNHQKTISNRTEMHAGVRSATELLQQEIGQAGRAALPGAATLPAGVVATGAQTVGVNMVINGATCGSNGASVPCVSGIFPNEWVMIDGGSNKESVQVTGVNTVANTITATFVNTHPAGTAINVFGGFASGIVPSQYTANNGVTWTPYPNGSDGTHLKLFGDINGDGNMVYVEYTCDTVSGNLYRNTMAYDAAAKPALTGSQVLLGNLDHAGNPGGTACFTYMPSPLPFIAVVTDAGCACTQSFVLDVAVTLTVDTQQLDPTTGKLQTETKALLNVSPRNVFNVWQMASVSLSNNNDRLQPMPASVKALLPHVAGDP